MAEADFHVVKPVSCQQNWGIRDGTRICSAAMIFQGAVRTGKEQVAMRSFVLASHDVGISFDSKIVQILRSETESKQFCVPKTRPTRIHRPMKSMTFETDEILHFGDMYQAKRPFLEIHRTDESDEIDEIWYRLKDSQNFKEFQQNFKKISKIQKNPASFLKNDVFF